MILFIFIIVNNLCLESGVCAGECRLPQRPTVPLELQEQAGCEVPDMNAENKLQSLLTTQPPPPAPKPTF